MQAKIEKCLKEIEQISGQIQDMRNPDATPLKDEAESKHTPESRLVLKPRRTLRGHFGKIYSMQWAPDSRHLVSASQDGKLIIWNGYSTNKVYAIPLRSSWVMTCAYSPSGSMVACGGLDNMCSVYKLPAQKDANSQQQQKTYCELAQHEGYLSCCRFIRDDEIITSSGDSTCILWDVERKTPKAMFNDHDGDVMSVAIFDSKDIFVSGSVDATAKVWDHRSAKGVVKTFTGHESDINSVAFFPDGNAFATASDDSSCRLFDIRAYRQINKYSDDKILCGITSVAFSHNGRYLFAGYDDFNCYAWDTAHGRIVTSVLGHDNRISCLGVSNDGKALCTGSWDQKLQIWA